MKNRIMTLNEFVASKPSPIKPGTNPGPGTAPSKPGTKPGPAPKRPSPIPGKRPAVDPGPLGKLEDVVDRFIKELDKLNKDVKFDIKKLRQRYENK